MKCKHYIVEALIQGAETVTVNWYKGTNGIKALAALAQAAAHDEEMDHGDLPQSMRYRTMHVGVSIKDWCSEHDGPWGERLTCMECTDTDGNARPVAWSEIDGSV
jgi:hypothetical protein